MTNNIHYIINYFAWYVSRTIIFLEFQSIEQCFLVNSISLLVPLMDYNEKLVIGNLIPKWDNYNIELNEPNSNGPKEEDPYNEMGQSKRHK